MNDASARSTVRIALAVGLFLFPAGSAAPIQESTDGAQPPRFWRCIEAAAEQREVDDELGVILDHLAGRVQRLKPAGRLQCVAEALERPWMVPQFTAELRELLLEFTIARSFEETWPKFAARLDFRDRFEGTLGEEMQELDEVWEELQDSTLLGQELLEHLSLYVGLGHDALASNLAHLGADESAELVSGFAAASEAWYRSHFRDLPDGEGARNGATLLAHRKVLLAHERERVFAIGTRMARLVTEEFVESLAARLQRTKKMRHELEGFRGDVIAVAGRSEESRVVLGGRGRATFGAAALIVDLGGGDEYTRAAVVDGSGPLVQMVIDLGGHDTYRAEGIGPVAAVGGVAIVHDEKGRDEYVGGRHAQACSIGGFALLRDRDGDDVYTAEDFSQAYARTGFALLVDDRGDDRYDSWAYSQGSGNGFGFSALVDLDGDDQYVADLHWPDVYGDSGPNVFHGAAQGFNLGFRDGDTPVAGGIAVFLDENGKDRYQAGSFSQGGGYYFGFGAMIDGGGDDESFGSRYAQGFGVHQAVGIRWDRGGDDVIHARSVAHGGCGWDEGVGYHIDEEGDDLYECGGLALGAAAQTAFGILLDLQGKDRYVTGGGPATIGGAGGTEYHDKPAFGVLLDLGGGRDEYSRTDRGDGQLLSGAEVGLFLDTKARDWERLWKELGR